MQRTTISLPEELLKRIRVRAAEEGESMASFIRKAVEERLAEKRPKPRCLGMGDSGTTDTARRTADERPEPRAWR